MDVVVYGAFKAEHLERMVEHSKLIPRGNPIQRGQKFAFLSAGSMIGVGSRVPAGGAPADTYRGYDVMRAESLEDINLLFNHAEV